MPGARGWKVRLTQWMVQMGYAQTWRPFQLADVAIALGEAKCDALGYGSCPAKQAIYVLPNGINPHLSMAYAVAEYTLTLVQN